tara:strand:+ start:1359 stop:2192 length:834 start_codon:yes stop_codon:yes gene_type:complete
MAPPIQKRKHPRFRKKLSDDERKKLKEAKKLKEKQLLDECLYRLPLDIKSKVFHMAVAGNMAQWSLEHKDKFIKTIHFLEPAPPDRTVTEYDPDNSDFVQTDSQKDKGGNKYIRKYKIPGVLVHDLPQGNIVPSNCLWDREDLCVIFKPNTLCKKNVKKKGQPGIKDVKIDGTFDKPIPQQIVSREWSNLPGKYWYHEKCRCSVCDRVRVSGYENLGPAEKKKYARIIWKSSPLGDRIKPWKTKSLKQVKYENEKKRNEYRKILKKVKLESTKHLIQ